MTDLARRAVACAAWKWMERMRAALHRTDWDPITLVTHGDVISALDPKHMGRLLMWWDDHKPHGKDREWSAPHFWFEPDPVDLLLPDFSDPATLGCLLALVREAFSAVDVHVIPTVYAEGVPIRFACWVVTAEGLRVIQSARGFGDDRAEALVAALEAAPQPASATA